MTKKYDIIHLNNFMYMVDKAIAKWEKPILGNKQLAYHGKETVRYANIIASNDLSLNLPLLPNIEEDIEQFAKDRATKLFPIGKDDANWRGCVEDFLMGYKAASKKKYTEEDMRNVFNSGQRCEHEGAYDKDSWFNGFISTLNPLPIAVEVEMEVDADDERNWYRDCPSGKYSDDEPIPPSRDNLFSDSKYLKPKVVNNIIQVKQWIYE
jgi:hypothetical protein